MINIGVIGYGYWGPNLVRNFSESGDFTVTMVADLYPHNLEKVKLRYPAIQLTTQFEELIKSTKVDAVAIATPVDTHFELGMKALQAGKHVFIEKPLAAGSEQASALLREAKKRNLILFVDHTFVYTGAVRKIKEIITSGQLGKIYYFDSVRINLGLFQHDVNVLWDLAVHDLSIMDYLLELKPFAVSAAGLSHIPGSPANIAYLTCFFEENLIAHIHVNWLAPVKIRKTLIGGDKKMIVYDDLEVTEKVKVYDKGVSVKSDPDSFYKLMVGYRTGDVWIPNLNTTEALRHEADCFAQSLTHGIIPVSDGLAGLRIVRILEAATLSLSQKGRPMNLDWEKLEL